MRISISLHCKVTKDRNSLKRMVFPLRSIALSLSKITKPIQNRPLHFESQKNWTVYGIYYSYLYSFHALSVTAFITISPKIATNGSGKDASCALPSPEVRERFL